MCFTIYKKRNLRTIPNAFFLNLAVSNILLTLSQLPILSNTIARGEWNLGERLCHFSAYLDIVLFSSNLFTLTAIGVNRYFKIVKPNRYGNVFFRKSVIFMVVFIWCLAITLCSGPFSGWGKYQFIPPKSLCSISENGQSSFRITSSAVVSFCHLHDNCLPHQNSPNCSSPQETNCARKKMYSEREPLTACT